MTTSLSYPRFKAWDLNGDFLVGGKVYTYVPGTDTNESTFSDPDLGTTNENPTVLNSEGEADIYLGNSVKMVLKDADGNLIWTKDKVEGSISYGLQTVYPEWFGAVGNGTTDDSAALTAAVAACATGGAIVLSKIYKTTGLLVEKSLSFISDTPLQYGTFSGGTLKAAGAQAYVLKFLGVFAAAPAAFLQPYLQNINIDGDNKAISDAALVMECCNFSYLDRVGFQNTDGHVLRLRTCWETDIINPWVNNCGSLDTGSAFYIDGPTPLDYARGMSNLRIIRGTWSSNRGRWIDISSLANLEGCWIEDNKFELDDLTILNTVDTNVIHIGASSRTSIIGNRFATFGATYGKYANLIWMGGVNDDGRAGAPGAGGDTVSENKYYGHTGSGAINGLSLGATSPTVVEYNNVAISDGGVTDVPNANVSIYPQLISLAWRGFDTTLIPTGLPDREMPNFVSIHKVARGVYAIPFAADADVINNSRTALSLSTASTSLAKVCASYDLRRFVGHSDTNLVVRLRMRLSGAGNNTVHVNPTDDGAGGGAWNGVPVVVNSTSWAWYEFVCPIANLTTANHFMDIYNYSINSGAASLLVDGMEFATSNEISETITVSGALSVVFGVPISHLDSTAGAIAGTLADGTVVGQRKKILMTNATASSTVQVANHVTSDPEIFTFATLGAYLELEWVGTEWRTVHNHGVTT